MKIKREITVMVIILVLLSAVLYFLHYLVFNDLHHVFIFFLGDIAFLPVEIVFVSLIFHKIIEEREKKNTLRKLNMLLGVFFSEIGNQLLDTLTKNDNHIDTIKEKLIFNNQWGNKDFENAISIVNGYDPDLNHLDFGFLKEFLGKHRDFLLKIMENPTLLEHEFFSELMMALFHLQEELINREDVHRLSENDVLHIRSDAARVYERLLTDWLVYMRHLKNEYPYLFSFAIRTNPFDDKAKVELD